MYSSAGVTCKVKRRKEVRLQCNVQEVDRPTPHLKHENTNSAPKVRILLITLNDPCVQLSKWLQWDQSCTTRYPTGSVMHKR